MFSFYEQVKCCGAQNGKDWSHSEWIKQFSKAIISLSKIPSSRCWDKSLNCFIGGLTTCKKIKIKVYYHLIFNASALILSLKEKNLFCTKNLH